MEPKQWWRSSEPLYNFIMQCAKRKEDGETSRLVQAHLGEAAYFCAGAKWGGFERGLKFFQMSVRSKDISKDTIEDIVNQGVQDYGGKTRLEAYNWNGTTHSNFQLLLEDNGFVSGGKTNRRYVPWGVGAVSGFAVDAGLSLVRIKSWRDGNIFKWMSSCINFDISTDKGQEKSRGNIYSEVTLRHLDMAAIEKVYLFFSQMQVELKGKQWELR